MPQLSRFTLDEGAPIEHEDDYYCRTMILGLSDIGRPATETWFPFLDQLYDDNDT